MIKPFSRAQQDTELQRVYSAIKDCCTEPHHWGIAGQQIRPAFTHNVSVVCATTGRLGARLRAQSHGSNDLATEHRDSSRPTIGRLLSAPCLHVANESEAATGSP